jgi:hypothetical protein
MRFLVVSHWPRFSLDSPIRFAKPMPEAKFLRCWQPL